MFQVMVRQEVQRKRGIAIQIEEEQLRTNLETAQAELNAPAQMKVGWFTSLLLKFHSGLEKSSFPIEFLEKWKLPS